MSIRKKLVKLKNDNMWLRLFWFHRLAKQAKESKKISDINVIHKSYKRTFGKEPDLENPKTYYEKLNWLKLHYRNDLMPIVADKYAVRRYLTDLGYKDLLNDIYGCWDNVDDFDEKKLPSRFVLKATHASGPAWFKIVMDSRRVNWHVYKKIMKQWLKQDIAWMGREWHYSKMKPRIICEKYLEDESGELRDYKFHCFNGEPKWCSVFTGRLNGKKRQVCFDLKWNHIFLREDDYAVENDLDIPKPTTFEKMVKIASSLSEPFPMVRVDFYEVCGKLYFGELTFFNASGFGSGWTEEAQLKIGEMLTLPQPNN